MVGRIVSVKADRGFCFIAPSDGGKEVFGHVSSMAGLMWSDELVGTRVAYTIEATDRGPRAINIRVAE